MRRRFQESECADSDDFAGDTDGIGHREQSRQITSRRWFLASAALGLTGVSVSCGSTRSEHGAVGGNRGVSLAGAEFGTDDPAFCNENPGLLGKDYTYNSRATVFALARSGFTTFRLPFRWERIQPTLGGPLAEAELDRLREAVGWVAAAGGRVVLDLHNYGRYRLRVGDDVRDVIVDEDVGGSSPVTTTHLSNLWTRLARVFSKTPAVVGYGLMNEPHDMGGSRWDRISQRVVDAIRRVDLGTYVFVAGDGWSNAHRWVEVNGARPWIVDRTGRVVYEAHCYFDAPASGKYTSPLEEERRRDPGIAARGVERVRPFVEWCRRNEVRGFVGEFGIPGDEPGWRPIVRRFLDYLDGHGVPSCYWAAGEWWGNYRLSIQPRDDGTAAPQTHDLIHGGTTSSNRGGGR